MTTTAEHVRNCLDGRWRDVKNQMRERLTDQIFRPHYTPNTVIARTKVAEQLRITSAESVLAARGLESAQDMRGLDEAAQRSIVLAIVRREIGVMALAALVILGLALRAEFGAT